MDSFTSGIHQGSSLPNVHAEPHAASDFGKTERPQSRVLALAPGSAVCIQLLRSKRLISGKQLCRIVAVHKDAFFCLDAWFSNSPAYWNLDSLAHNEIQTTRREFVPPKFNGKPIMRSRVF